MSIDRSFERRIARAPLAAVAIAGASIVLAILAAYRMRTPQFPWGSLSVEETSISSSLWFNPYSACPPRHRLELEVSFRPFSLKKGSRPYASFISYSIDLSQRGWKDFPGTYELESRSGSDFWHGDENLGPVILERVQIEPTDTARHTLVLELAFEFDDGTFAPGKRRISVSAPYDGLSFDAPTWSHPEEVSLPSAWAVPSTNPQWTDQEVLSFLGKYVDLAQYEPPVIDHSGSSTRAQAAPKR